MLQFQTAGESHGKGGLALVTGFPAGLRVSEEAIDAALARRQGGYGRGGRQKIETDRVEILSGLRRGATLGSPIALWIKNRDERITQIEPKSVPRPGHADLAGAWKYGTNDIIDIAERSSARETTARVAAGALARQLLSEFGIEVCGYVSAIGPVEVAPAQERWTPERIRRAAGRSQFYTLNSAADERLVRLIDATKRAGDTLGGIVEVAAFGVPPGLGSHVQWDTRLDARLARAVMAIQAIKGVEIGRGFEVARLPGSKAHDGITRRGLAVARASNHAGGLEGGITNGMPVIVRGAMKPISTLMRPVDSIDLKTGRKMKATIIRSDVCAVPACSVIAEAVVGFELASAFLEKFGGDSLRELRHNHRAYLATIPWKPAAAL